MEWCALVAQLFCRVLWCGYSGYTNWIPWAAKQSVLIFPLCDNVLHTPLEGKGFPLKWIKIASYHPPTSNKKYFVTFILDSALPIKHQVIWFTFIINRYCPAGCIQIPTRFYPLTDGAGRIYTRHRAGRAYGSAGYTNVTVYLNIHLFSHVFSDDAGRFTSQAWSVPAVDCLWF